MLNVENNFTFSVDGKQSGNLETMVKLMSCEILMIAFCKNQKAYVESDFVRKSILFCSSNLEHNIPNLEQEKCKTF